MKSNEDLLQELYSKVYLPVPEHERLKTLMLANLMHQHRRIRQQAMAERQARRRRGGRRPQATKSSVTEELRTVRKSAEDATVKELLDISISLGFKKASDDRSRILRHIDKMIKIVEDS